MKHNLNYILSVTAFVFSLTCFSSLALALDEEDLFFGEDSVIENIQLDELRGTALSPEILGMADLQALSANNSAVQTISGGNTINSGAFSESSGLSTIIQNSGNNVLIQSATILNVNIE